MAYLIKSESEARLANVRSILEAKNLDLAQKHKVNYVLIDDKYVIDI